MKKTFIYGLLATSFLTCSALASSFDGVYIGAGGAYYQNKMDVSLDQEGLLSPDVNFMGNTSFSTASPYFHGQIGFGHAFSRFYFGGLAFADIGQSENSGVITSTWQSSPMLKADVTAKLNNIYGFDFKPGFLLTSKLMVYGLAGIAATNIEGTATFSTQNGSISTGQSQNFNTDFSAGYHLGAGIEYLILPHLSANLEWSTMKWSVYANGDPEFDWFNYNTFVYMDKIDINSDRILAGLNFRF